MSEVILKTGALPHEDDSGWGVEIQVRRESIAMGEQDRVWLEQGGDTVWFLLSDWPAVKEAVEDAIKARNLLRGVEGSDDTI